MCRLKNTNGHVPHEFRYTYGHTGACVTGNPGSTRAFLLQVSLIDNIMVHSSRASKDQSCFFSRQRSSTNHSNRAVHISFDLRAGASSCCCGRTLARVGLSSLRKCRSPLIASEFTHPEASILVLRVPDSKTSSRPGHTINMVHCAIGVGSRCAVQREMHFPGG